MAKKEKITVWMSRDSETQCYEFWSKRPEVCSRQYFDKKAIIRKRTTINCISSVCYTRYVHEILNPIRLRKRGLYKLTITAERIE